MYIVLPPPRGPNPPSPWESILCANAGTAGINATERRSRGKRPPRIRLRSFPQTKKHDDTATGLSDEVDATRTSKSLSECYFAGKGTALVLPEAEAQRSHSKRAASGQGQGNNIQKHLQSMFYLLRPEETLKMAVKLESVHPNRTRYLVVVSRMGKRAEESCLLGIDCNEKTTVGLVLRVLADTSITLDGDGGFSVSVCGRHHIFKPVSVQAMWSALQTLHKVSSKARGENYFQGGLTHAWVSYYEDRIESDRSCLNEWHAMDNLESRRPPSPDSVRTKPHERDETERVIRSTLKEIMMSVDLDEVTSKYIRGRLEEDLDMDLGEYKSFIDHEIMTILGQMDAPTEIFEHVYLGSEWNASNYEELQKNGVGHILNVTREIDNFFPGTFDYLNVRVYDDEKTDLLKHWDDTFKYITKAKSEGSKVLVHCKMGISRSASVVIAYAMKAYNWDFQKAMRHVKEKRSCIKPNTSFLSQLETYQGMLDAMKNKEKLQRSKSETNLKSPGIVAKSDRSSKSSQKTSPVLKEPPQGLLSGQELRQMGGRPKSWSPDNSCVSGLLQEEKGSQVSRSLEDLKECGSRESLEGQPLLKKPCLKEGGRENVLMPCDNGEAYSVSPNRIVHLPGLNHDFTGYTVRDKVSELESGKERPEKKKLVLNLQTELQQEELRERLSEENPVVAQTKSSPPMLRAVLVKKETWDPGEQQHKPQTPPPPPKSCSDSTSDVCDRTKCNSVSDGQQPVLWTSSAVVQQQTISGSVVKRHEVPDKSRKDGDPFSSNLDKVFDKEEKRQQRLTLVSNEPTAEDGVHRECPSRQSSWSSYDSAVVLGYQGESREAPSRHSSWGSGDTRTLPSRNSSWGSYDMRSSTQTDVFETSSGLFPYDKEDIPWYPGTVRRTKQKLEENAGKKQESDSSTEDKLHMHVDCPTGVLVTTGETTVEAFNASLIRCSPPLISANAVSDNVDISSPSPNLVAMSRLSVSAPESSSMELVPQQQESLSRSASNVSSIGKLPKDTSSSVISTAQCSSVKQHRNYLENLLRDGSSKKLEQQQQQQQLDEANVSGIVSKVKREFEAKSTVHLDVSEEGKCKKGGVSLPTSPVSLHQSKEPNRPLSPDQTDDLNFKKLIGKFEKTKPDASQVILRPKNTSKPFRAPRHTCYELSTTAADKSSPRRQPPLISMNNRNSSVDGGEYKRPPIPPLGRGTAPNVVVATVIAKAAKKQQQYGKSHPLARLNIKPRHNNPVYNTM